jgi:hypothetical protein
MATITTTTTTTMPPRILSAETLSKHYTDFLLSELKQVFYRFIVCGKFNTQWFYIDDVIRGIVDRYDGRPLTHDELATRLRPAFMQAIVENPEYGAFTFDYENDHFVNVAWRKTAAEAAAEAARTTTTTTTTAV